MPITKRTGSPHYQYDFTIKGRRFRGSTETDNREAARRIEAKLKNDVIDGTYFNKKPSITIDAAYARFWEDHAQYLKSGLSAYVGCIRNLKDGLGANTPLHAITDDMLAKYVSRRKQSFSKQAHKKKHLISNATINKELRVLSSLLSHARKWSVALPECLIKEHMQPTREPLTNYITQQQFTKLLSVSPRPLQQQLIFLLNTGVRHGNLQTLEWPQVNFNEGILIFKTKSRKPGGQLHIISMNRVVRALLLDMWKEQHKPDTGLVFKVQCPKKAFRKALEAAGIERERGQLFHLLRHTAASWILKNGGDIYKVKEFLGHSDIKMTVKYAHPHHGSGKDTANLLVRSQLRHNVKVVKG